MFNFRTWKRHRIRRQSWPADSWDPILNNRFPAFLKLRAPFAETARTTLQILFKERRFEGCGGLQITDPVKLTILGQASLLLLGDSADFYHTIRSILVYPDTYTAPVRRREYDGFVVTEGFESRLGESWSFGNIVLAWDSVQKQARTFGNGINVTLHEFAHHLDQEFGVSEQVDSTDTEDIPDWILSIRLAYHHFVGSVRRGSSNLLDPYGAQNPAEFFAVASENFIECPDQLHTHFPRLFEGLRFFYQFDPRQLFDTSREFPENSQ